MITQKTASQLQDTWIAMDNCKNALSLLKGKKKASCLTANVYIDDQDVCVFISKSIAKAAIEEQLKTLEAAYIALNNKAVEEAKTL